MKYKAIIFDMDGVICHTDKYHYQAWKEIADELNIYFNQDINNRLRGISREESFRIILENYDGEMPQEEINRYIEKKNSIYVKLLNNMSPADLGDDVEKALNKLRDMKIKLAIGSSSKNARFILNQLGLSNFFDAISDGNSITKSKPDPEVFLKAAEYLNIQAEMCIVVEDALAGIEAAKAAKMGCCAIGDAVTSKDAMYHINSLIELLDIV